MNLLYIPKRAVTVQHSAAYANENHVPLSFKIESPPIFDNQLDRNIERALNGRACVTVERQYILLGVNARNLDTKDKPIWWELIQSTRCGEEVIVDVRGLPVECMVKGGECIIINSRLTPIDKFTFDAFLEFEWHNLAGD